MKRNFGACLKNRFSVLPAAGTSFCFMLFCFMLFCFSSCGGAKPSSIEPAEWVMSTIQRTADGTVLYCAENERGQFPEASVKNISCTIRGTDVTIRDSESERAWSGTYEKSEASKESTVYEVIFENERGQIVTSLTEYRDGTASRKTLLLRCGGYTLNFFDKEGD